MGCVYGLHAGDYRIRYVGFTRHTAEDRRQAHFYEAFVRNSNRPVYHWIRKYGTVQVLVLDESDDIDTLGRLETQWIAVLNTSLPVGLNVMKGGQGTRGHSGFSHSVESRLKMSEALRGRTPWNKGRTSPLKGQKRDPAIGQRISEAKRGRPSGTKGMTFSPEARIRMSEAARKRARPSLETREKIANSKRNVPLTKEHRANISRGSKAATIPQPGGHVRWHVNRGVHNSECSFCRKMKDATRT